MKPLVRATLGALLGAAKYVGLRVAMAVTMCVTAAPASAQGILLGGGSVAEFNRYQQDYIKEMGMLIADAKIRVE